MRRHGIIQIIIACIAISCTTANVYSNGKIPLNEKLGKYLASELSQPPTDFALTIETRESFDLMWSDPGYVKGPAVADAQEYYVVTYSTTKYNQDATIKYIDNWKYFFPADGKKYCYRYNAYSGTGYHGKSMVYMYGLDTLAKPELPPVLARDWDTFVTGLHLLLFQREE